MEFIASDSSVELDLLIQQVSTHRYRKCFEAAIAQLTAILSKPFLDIALERSLCISPNETSSLPQVCDKIAYLGIPLLSKSEGSFLLPSLKNSLSSRVVVSKSRISVKLSESNRACRGTGELKFQDKLSREKKIQGPRPNVARLNSESREYKSIQD
jgi:hypothetical protein